MGDTPTPAAVTPTDVREYRGDLVTVERRQPATVNRRLAALRRFFQWALAIVLTLRHTGLRVSELCGLTLADVEISARKGALTVRSGKDWPFSTP